MGETLMEVGVIMNMQEPKDDLDQGMNELEESDESTEGEPEQLDELDKMGELADLDKLEEMVQSGDLVEPETKPKWTN